MSEFDKIKEGWNHYQDDGEIGDNPYEVGTPEHGHWRCGFEAAQDE